MFKIIVYSIITIAIIHFILYYFNIDYSHFNYSHFNNFTKLFKSKDKSINDTVIYDSINELKTLNECINNGQIDTSFS